MKQVRLWFCQEPCFYKCIDPFLKVFPFRFLLDADRFDNCPQSRTRENGSASAKRSDRLSIYTTHTRQPLQFRDRKSSMLLRLRKNSLANRLSTYFALLSESKGIAALAAANLVCSSFLVVPVVIYDFVDVFGDHEVISHASRTRVAPDLDDLGFSLCHRFTSSALVCPDSRTTPQSTAPAYDGR